MRWLFLTFKQWHIVGVNIYIYINGYKTVMIFPESIKKYCCKGSPLEGTFDTLKYTLQRCLWKEKAAKKCLVANMAVVNWVSLNAQNPSVTGYWENGVSTAVIKWWWGHKGGYWPIQYDWHPYRKGNLDTDMVLSRQRKTWTMLSQSWWSE